MRRFIVGPPSMTMTFWGTLRPVEDPVLVAGLDLVQAPARAWSISCENRPVVDARSMARPGRPAWAGTSRSSGCSRPAGSP